MEPLEQGSKHADLHQTFDHRVPLDAFHGQAADAPDYLVAWALLALVAFWATRIYCRRTQAPRAFSWVVFFALLTFLPSMRDGALVAAAVGLLTLWIIASRWASFLDPLARRARGVLHAVQSATPTRFAVMLFVGCFLLYTSLGWLLFRWLPVIQDSQAHYFQAKLLAGGQLTAPTPPLGEFFLAENMVQDGGHWYGIYPLGHVALLALAQAVAGAPFLVNPFLGASTSVLLWAGARETYPESTARIAALLFALSPFVAYMSAEYMNHSLAAAALCLEVLAVLHLTRQDTVPSVSGVLAWSALAGVGAGWLFTTKVLTFAATQLVVGVFLLQRLVAQRRYRLVLGLATMAVVSSAFLAAQLAYNQGTTGDAWKFGYAVGYPSLHYGFGDSPWGPHTPTRALEYLLRYADAANVYLTALPIPALALALVAFRNQRQNPHAQLALSLFVVTLFVYAGWCFQDLTFGPRYLYAVSVVLLPLFASGLPQAVRWAAGAAEDARLARSAFAACAIAALGLLPALGVYYRLLYGLDDGVVKHAAEQLPQGSLVFVDGKYQRAFFAVNPDLSGPYLFARDLGDHNAALVCSMPERPAWLERGSKFERLTPDCSSKTAAH